MLKSHHNSDVQQDERCLSGRSELSVQTGCGLSQDPPLTSAAPSSAPGGEHPCPKRVRGRSGFHTLSLQLLGLPCKAWCRG